MSPLPLWNFSKIRRRSDCAMPTPSSRYAMRIAASFALAPVPADAEALLTPAAQGQGPDARANGGAAAGNGLESLISSIESYRLSRANVQASAAAPHDRSGASATC